MSILTRWPLRFTAPVVLAAAVSALLLLYVRTSTERAVRDVEEFWTENVTQTASELQGLLEPLARKGDVEGVAAGISSIASDADLLDAVLADEEEIVRYSTRLARVGSSLSTAAPEIDKKTLDDVRTTQAGRLLWSPDRSILSACYPIVLGAKPGEARPSRFGVLWLRYDVGSRKAWRLHLLEVQLRHIALGAAAVFALLWVLIHRSLTRRESSIIAAAERFASGDLAARTGVTGGDELAQIGAAFDGMAGRVGRDRERLEELVRERTADLELTNERLLQEIAGATAANAELGALSYSIAHDLRAPLRAIDGFGSLLEDRCGNSLDAESRRLMGVVRGNARKMGHLIDDLLGLFRIDRREISAAALDMEGLSRSVLGELTLATGARDLETTIARLPPAVGDEDLVRVVFRNLLENALKFSALRKPSVIEIGFAAGGTGAAYFVRDNGVGFDPRYSTKLFGVFEHLHDPAEFEGTGIGLALVKRIVARHGGRAWAESAVDRGATFWFTLGPYEPA